MNVANILSNLLTNDCVVNSANYKWGYKSVAIYNNIWISVLGLQNHITSLLKDCVKEKI